MELTIDKIAKGLFVSLISLFFINEYIEVPEFALLFLLLCVAFLFVTWKEILEFKKAKEAITYDFMLKRTIEQSRINAILGYAFFILILIIPFFVEFPFDKRTDPDDTFYFYILLLVIGIINFVTNQFVNQTQI